MKIEKIKRNQHMKNNGRAKMPRQSPRYKISSHISKDCLDQKACGPKGWQWIKM